MNQIKSDRLDASENKAFYKELLSLAIPIGMQKSADSFNRCNRRTYARQTYAGFCCRRVTGKSDCVYVGRFSASKPKNYVKTQSFYVYNRKTMPNLRVFTSITKKLWQISKFLLL